MRTQATRSVLLCLFVVTAGVGSQPAGDVESTEDAAHVEIPVTGKNTPGVHLLDQVILKHLEKIGCSCATLAISYQGRVVHPRGYGWSDKERRIPTRADTMIGMASCDKPITAAAAHQLARHRRLNLDARVFRTLRIQPKGEVVDQRVWNITFRHLLQHKAGWQGAALQNALRARREKEPKAPYVETVLGYVMVQKLASDPGTKYAYCNFCYATLQHTIAEATGVSAVDYFRRILLQPFGFKEVRGFEAPWSPRREHDPPLVWNNNGGIKASAPALCAFMECYWLTGAPRDDSKSTWRSDGSLPGSTAMMLWRPDGINVAFLFNGRGKTSHNEIIRDLEQVIDRLKGSA